VSAPVEDFGMLATDHCVEPVDAFLVGQIGLVHKPGNRGSCSVAIDQVSRRFPAKRSRHLLLSQVFVGYRNKRFAQRDAEFVENWKEQVKVDGLERSIRGETIERPATYMDPTLGKASPELTDANSALAERYADGGDNHHAHPSFGL
jgi:hypothetical protein